MDIGSILVVLAVVIAVGLYLSQPLLGRSRRMTSEKREVSALLAERDRVVNSLQELDFDFTLNKIPADDYPVQRAALLQKGADILKQLDAITPSFSPDNGKGGKSTADRIESALAARRTATAVTALNDDDIESLIASRRAARKEK